MFGDNNARVTVCQMKERQNGQTIDIYLKTPTNGMKCCVNMGGKIEKRSR